MLQCRIQCRCVIFKRLRVHWYKTWIGGILVHWSGTLCTLAYLCQITRNDDRNMRDRQNSHSNIVLAVTGGVHARHLDCRRSTVRGRMCGHGVHNSSLSRLDDLLVKIWNCLPIKDCNLGSGSFKGFSNFFLDKCDFSKFLYVWSTTVMPISAFKPWHKSF